MAPLSAEDERWRSLCEQTAHEQDLARRIELVREINRQLIKWLLEQEDHLSESHGFLSYLCRESLAP